ncbi:MAG: hypothetical protein JNM80_03090 [Phycisphaerae bacterium]|nr:hypothetical protein [Phycisphaerae bacterium]
MARERPIDLARLREDRGFRPVDTGIADAVRDLARDARARTRRGSGMHAAFEALLPATLHGRSTTAFRAGTLTVRAADASARFRLDALVRALTPEDLARLGVGRIKVV